MKNRLSFLFLFIIFIFGTYLRFDRLGSYPVSLNWDEASHGYNAFSLIMTQRDEWGLRFPFIFRAFGDYKLPSYIYLSTVPIYLFGLSVFSVRFVSALAGSLAIIGIYFLTNLVLNNTKFSKSEKWGINPGLISAFLLSTTPWHFFISRAALEANLALTLIIYGLLFLFVNKRWFNNIGIVLLGVSLHTYNTARVFVPVLLVILYIFDRSVLPSFRKIIPGFAIFFLCLVVVVLQFLNGTALARYDKLSILNPSSVYQIELSRNNSHLPSILPKLIYNRPVYLFTTIARNYISYFSPAFIYQTDQPQSQFAIPGQPLFTQLTLLLFIVSIFGIVEIINIPLVRAIAASLMVSPLAASFTASSPQALRPNPMILSFIILSAIGLSKVLIRFHKFYLPVIIVCLILQMNLFISYQRGYYESYSASFASSWQYGYQQAYKKVNQLRLPDQTLFVSKYLGEPHIFYAFYNQLDPKLLFPGSSNIRFYQTGWYWTDKLADTYFVNDWQIPNGIPAPDLKLESGTSIPTSGSLLITSPDHLPSNFEVQDKVVYPNGETVFIIAKSK